MKHISLLLCTIIIFGSLSGCLDSNTSSGTEESDQIGEQNSQIGNETNQSGNETDVTIPMDDMGDDINSNGQRVNINGLPWSALIADCEDQLKPNIWDARGLVDLFNAIDYDDSGDLSYCEIFIRIDKILMPYDSEYAMHRWTAGNSNSFTFDEYFDFEQSRSPGMRYQEDLYQEAFNIADSNQDYRIDETEIDSFIMETYEVYTGILVDNDLIR